MTALSTAESLGKMTSDKLWLSRAPADASNLRPLTNSFVGTERQESGKTWGASNSAGEPLPKECFPEEIFGTPDAKDSAYRLPDLFSDGNFWVVSSAAHDVLRQFNLGRGALYPVRILKKDRQTEVGGDWYCLNFGNKKQAFVLEKSTSVRDYYIRPREKGWVPKATVKDGDIVFSNEAYGGPDIWIDPQVGSAFFLSDALGAALKKAKADKGFFLFRCGVI